MLNLLWGGIESNQVGTAEFVDSCRRVGRSLRPSPYAQAVSKKLQPLATADPRKDRRYTSAGNRRDGRRVPPAFIPQVGAAPPPERGPGTRPLPGHPPRAVGGPV